MNEQRRIPDVRVVVDGPADPFLLRPAIDARLAGRPWPSGPEAIVAEEVARAVDLTEPRAGGAPREDPPWR